MNELYIEEYDVIEDNKSSVETSTNEIRESEDDEEEDDTAAADENDAIFDSNNYKEYSDDLKLSDDYFFITNVGVMKLDDRWTKEMLPWICKDFGKNNSPSDLVLFQINKGTIRITSRRNSTGETGNSCGPQSHEISDVVCFTRYCDNARDGRDTSHEEEADGDDDGEEDGGEDAETGVEVRLEEEWYSAVERVEPDPQCNRYFGYVISSGDTCRLYMYETSSIDTVKKIYQLLRVSSDSDLLHLTDVDITAQTAEHFTIVLNRRTPKLNSGNTGTGLELNIAMTHLYEVKYVGRVEVTDQRSNTAEYVDEVIERLCAPTPSRMRCNSETSIIGSMTSSYDVITSSSSSSIASADSHDSSSLTTISSMSSGASSTSLAPPIHRDRSNSLDHHHNSIQLLQLGERELFTISTNRKQVFMRRRYDDISFCAQGISSKEHFGIIAREPDHSAPSIYCHIFKCSDAYIVGDIMHTLKQAFQFTFRLTRNLTDVCHDCPMNQYHLLCKHLQNLDKKSRLDLIIKRIGKLSYDDRHKFADIVAMYERDTKSIKKTSQLIMKTLRELCERKQTLHCHSRFTHNHNDIVLIDSNKIVEKFDILKLKARKSFTNIIKTIKNEERGHTKKEGFAHSKDTKTKAEKPHSIIHTNSTPKLQDSCDLPKKVRFRSRSNTMPVMSHTSTTTTTPMYANKVCLETCNEVSNRKESFRIKSFKRSSITLGPETKQTTRSWRMEIMNKVVSRPSANYRKSYTLNSLTVDKPRYKIVGERWRKAVLEIILLMKMERENKSIEEKQDKMQVMRDKLDYAELGDETTGIANYTRLTCDPDLDNSHLVQAIRKGVPKSKRGEVWSRFCSQEGHASSRRTHQHHQPPNYGGLLCELTKFQHAILIDLGRTFPCHPYFEVQLGAGQLCLFNVLKAYSLHDKDVGYCQGLSFVAGLLLVHMNEEDAFKALSFLMYDRHFRLQYKSDMLHMQLQLYQFSRLLHDEHLDVFDHLELYDIAPIHYCAPWLLTMFASEFPMGFVSRVFDYLFLDGIEVIYKVGMLLIGSHKKQILACNSIETIMTYLKTSIPNSSTEQFSDIIDKIDDMDIADLMSHYEIEYNLLAEVQSTATTSPPDDVACDDDAASSIGIEDMTFKLQQTTHELMTAHRRIDSLQRELEVTAKTCDDLKVELAGVLLVNINDDPLTRSHDSGFCSTPTSIM